MSVDLNRINELAKLSKQRELTDAEKAEQKVLREEYIKGYRANLKAQLDNIVIVDENGNKKLLKK
ncbi:MAG: DUF896 domain-containing protein [Oscillospiraceae bacterium]